MSKETAKSTFRQASLKRLRQVAKRGAYSKDKHVLDALYKHILDSNAQHIMLYLPLKIEVNLYPLIKKLRQQKRTLYVKSFRLVKYRLPLYKKQFGIKEPKDSKQYKIKQIDIAIVPIVGVDATRRRVGFGKGMYDRFFEKNKKNIRQVVFVARELCYAKEIVTDHYDVKADMIFTP